ncbi:hypothetical protein CCYA_CCYA07G2039 [Cyanidiococcus yangmingshanensis]|nr:hypothetical protein CCYA_CCYA07G2039 [Cyanidiococcus yangmingshanensis]
MQELGSSPKLSTQLFFEAAASRPVAEQAALEHMITREGLESTYAASTCGAEAESSPIERKSDIDGNDLSCSLPLGSRMLSRATEPCQGQLIPLDLACNDQEDVVVVENEKRQQEVLASSQNKSEKIDDAGKCEDSGISVHIFPDGYSLSESGYPRYSFGSDSRQILFCFDQGVLPPHFEIRGAKRLEVTNGKYMIFLYDHTRSETKKFCITLRMDYLNICMALVESPYVRETRQVQRALLLEAAVLRMLYRLKDLEPYLDPQTLSSHTKPSQVMNFVRTCHLSEETTYTRRLPVLDLFLRKRIDRRRQFRRNTNPGLVSQTLFLVAGNESLNRYRRMCAQGGSASNNRLPRSIPTKTTDDQGDQLLRKPVLPNLSGRLLRQMRFVLQRNTSGLTRIQSNPSQFTATSTVADELVTDYSSASASERNIRSTSRSIEPRTVCLVDIIVRPQRGCECVIRRGQEKSRDLDILRVQIGSEKSAHAFANQFRRLLRGEGFVCEQDLTLPSEGKVAGAKSTQEHPTLASTSLRHEGDSGQPL